MDCLLSGGWTVADDENNGYARIVRFYDEIFDGFIVSIFWFGTGDGASE